jgi:hypothetical protein
MFENTRITERDTTQKERALARESESRGAMMEHKGATDTVQEQQEQQKAEGLGSGVS